jgi:hypothetical protein
MSKRSCEDFAQAEIACMQASIDNLMQRYVRPGSSLAIALNNTSVSLSDAASAVHLPKQYRKKPVGRYAGGAR